MGEEQHTIAELQELAEHLRDKLDHAEKQCAARREAICDLIAKATVKLRRDEKDRLICGSCGFVLEGPHLGHAPGCLVPEIIKQDNAANDDCGDGYVPKSEVERLREALQTIANLCQLTGVNFEAQSFEATEIARAALKEDGR